MMAGAAAKNTVNPATFGPKVGATLGGMLAPQGPSAPASYVAAVNAGAQPAAVQAAPAVAPVRATGGKGGMGGQPAAPAPTQGQYSPVAPQQGFNVNQAASGALQGALGSTMGAMLGPVGVSAFMNPYQQEVINRTQMDIMRQQEMAQNQLGAQATQARAFGGSRQGVAEGVLAGEYGRMAGDIAAQQRQAGFTTALDAAMRDRAARLGAASQLGALGQQAFQTGQTIQQQQAQQGLLQQGMQQALIDAAKAQYGGYVGAPAAALGAPLAALGATPSQSTTTTSQSPGLFNYFQVLAGMCWVAREVYGPADPKWLQFREWVIGYSPDWFYNAYSKYGEKVAKVVRKVPALKAIIRPFMDSKRKSLGYK